MSGYPHNPQGYGNGPPPSQPYSSGPYGAAPGPATSQPYSSAPYGAAPGPAPSQPYSSAPYGAAPGPAPSQPYSSAPYGAAPPSPGGQHQYAPTASPYGAPSAPYAPSSVPGDKPHKENKPYAYGAHPPPSGYPPQGHQQYGGSPFASLVPSAFPPGTDPSIVACFQIADQDGSGLIDDKELQGALSSYNQSFSLRTVHLLMYNFTNSNSRKIGPKEFTGLYYGLQNWRSIFDRFDRDRSGKIDTGELREALLSLGFGVSPAVLELLVSKFDKTGGRNRTIEYDNFIECCLTVKGLTEKFKEKDTKYSGSVTFTYESFMLTVLPFLIA